MRKNRTLQLPLDVQNELKLFAQHIQAARKRRNMTLADLAERTNVSLSTLSRLEKGDPTVAFGSIVKTLSILGLLRGLSECIAPEQDIEQTVEEVRRLRSGKRPQKASFKDEELDF